jgi:hypothetical protein
MLVGREREVAALQRALAQLADHRGGVYLVCGEPGIGKTRLADEVATLAASRGARVAWGRCWEAGGAPAFWPWHDAFGAIALKFPEGGTIATSDPVQARFALFRDVASELGRAVESAPLVIVLEDLHAADQSSLLLLEFLSTQLRALPIVIVGTYRDLEASLRAEVGDVLARVGRSGQVLALRRLYEGEVATIVRETIENADDSLAANVYETTNGNPLFVAEMLQQARSGAASTTIPLGVREIIRQRLGLVSAAARRVLDAGAVLGVEFGAAEIARLVPDAAAEIDAAITSGLVTRTGDRVRFAHALYREALYHDLSRAARQALHRDAARVLSSTGAPAAEIAHHLLESDADAAPEAIDQAIVASRHALTAFAFEDAIAVLERARRAVPPGPLGAALRTRVTIALGEVRLRSGDPKGRELCVEAARAARELGDASLLALAGLAYGSVFMIGGVDPVMVGMLEDALAGLPDGDSGLRARTMARLAAARQPSAPALRQRDLDLALAAVEMGRRSASHRELLEILQSASGALYGATHPSVRLSIARQQIQLAEELGDAPRLLAGYVRISFDHLELGDFAGYEAVANAYERLVERFGAAAMPWRVPLMRSMLAIARDDFAESERWQVQAAKIDPDGPRANRARALHRICFLRAAERHAQLGASIGELRSLWLALPYGAALAESRVASCLMRIGADQEVQALLAELPADVYEEQINWASLAEAVWCTADREQALRLLPLLRSSVGRWYPYWLDVEIVEFCTERSLANLEAIAGDFAAAERYFTAMLRDLERIGRRTSIARAKFEMGDLLVRLGHDVTRARGLLAEARALADQLGLVELVALIDRRHAPQTTKAQPARRTFSIAQEGEYYAIATATGTLRFKATRGFQYLAQLVERAGEDIHVLELVGATEADRGSAGDVTDAKSMRAYRERAEALRDIVEDAEQRGDADRAERARSELEALAAELSRSSGIGGKLRRSESAVDRARSAVQRRIKDALDRIAEQDPELGAWLRRVVHTGNHCSFQGNA